MPSASGVYSLPVGYLAVTGDPILASQHNPPLEDIAAALTARLSRDGSAPMTAGLRAVPGSAALPGVTFSTDTSTGVYKTTNGVGISVAGAQVAEFTAAGMASGVRMLGELVYWTRVTCPALFVFPAGQTLSRTTYAALWAQAQIEIAAGSTFFNNGNGSTTFGIGDMRGRVAAALDNLGGSAASRLTATYFGTAATVLGAVGGLESHTLAGTEIPAHLHPITDQSHTHTLPLQNGIAGTVGPQGSAAGGLGNASVGPSAAFTGIVTTNNNTGGGGAHKNVQPTMALGVIMFAGA